MDVGLRVRRELAHRRRPAEPLRALPQLFEDLLVGVSLANSGLELRQRLRVDPCHRRVAAISGHASSLEQIENSARGRERPLRLRPDATLDGHERPPRDRVVRRPGRRPAVAARGYGRRHHDSRQAALEARPGRDRRARGTAAERSGRRLGDERQDDHDGDGRGDPRPATSGWPGTARAPTSSRESPPRFLPLPMRSSASSRSTRQPCRRPLDGSSRAPSSSGTSSVTSSIATASSSTWRRAGGGRCSPSPTRPRSSSTATIRRSGVSHAIEKARSPTASTIRATRAPRCSTPPTPATASAAAPRTSSPRPTSAISATTAAPPAGTRGRSSRSSPVRSSCTGSRAPPSSSSRPPGRFGSACGCPGSTTSTTRSRPQRSRRRSATGSRRSGTASSGSIRRSAASSGSRAATSRSSSS